MPRSIVKVVLRTRPTDSKSQEQAFGINPASKTVTIVHGGRSSSTAGGLPSQADKSGPPQRYQFKFDDILHNASQEDVFELCAADVLQSALQGFNGAIICYGQTGAGKTFTMTGNRQSFSQRGLIPRVITAALTQLAAAPGLSSWRLGVSYLEIYNEGLFDLLDLNTQPHELSLYEDTRGHMQVSGLRRVEVTSEAQALALFFEGETNRVIGEHQLNRESSRSHSVFMLHLGLTRQGEEGQQEVVSKVCLVDLAGSERVSKTRSEGLLLREAGHINKSLHILEQVVLAAAERGRDHVPYRSSKLTHVLRDCLGGNCKTVLIANVWGDAPQLDETLSTCRFAARMARLICEVRSNIVAQGGPRLRALEREVQELKEELAMMDLITQLQALQWQQQHQHQGQHHQQQEQQQQQQEQQQEEPEVIGDGSSSSNNNSGSGSSKGLSDKYLPFSAAERAKLRRTVLAWLQQPALEDDPDAAAVSSNGAGLSVLSGLPLSSVRQLRELLLAFKGVVRDALQASNGAGQQQQEQQCSAAGSAGCVAATGGAEVDPSAAAADTRWHKYVGDGADMPLMSAAPDDARPGSSSVSSSAAAAAAAGWQQPGDDDAEAAAGPGPGSSALLAEPPCSRQGNLGCCRTAAAAAAALPDSAAALEEYRAGPGAAQYQLLSDNRVKLHTAKKRSKELALALNGVKRQLDGLKQQQEELRAARQAAEAGSQEPQAALGPEEYQLLMDIRDIKGQYRDMHAELSLLRDEVGYTAGLLETCKAELAAHFEAWLAHSTYGSSPAAAAAAGCIPGLQSTSTSAAGSLQQWAAPAHSSPSSRPDSSSSINSMPVQLPQLQSAAVQQQQQQQQQGAAGLKGSCSLGGGAMQQHSQLTRGPPGGASGVGGSRNSSRQATPPLASLVGSLQGADGDGGEAADSAADDPQAAAYYQAQASAAAGRILGGSSVAGGHRPGSAKKHRGERGTFSLSERSQINDYQPIPAASSNGR